jgi:adenosylcobinamide-GDP ribazoletransferase
VRNARSLRVALSLFTVIPAGTGGALAEGDAVRAVRWLPAVGLLLGAIGAGAIACVDAGGFSAPRRLLGAALAIVLLALLTGGLHLDGLADTADGLGSRRPAADALAIMRRSDVGPFGIAALVLVLLIQVAALASIPRMPLAAGSLVLATVTGRVAVVVATGSPAARPGGFGALVAGRTTARERAVSVALLGCAVVAGGFATAGAELAVRGLIAALAGLLAGGLVRRTASRRLGGMTGDVFGAIVEVSTAAVLVACALFLLPLLPGEDQVHRDRVVHRRHAETIPGHAELGAVDLGLAIQRQFVAVEAGDRGREG